MANTTIDELKLDIIVQDKNAVNTIKKATSSLKDLERVTKTFKDNLLSSETIYKRVNGAIEQVTNKYDKQGKVISTVRKEVATMSSDIENISRTYQTFNNGILTSSTSYTKVNGAVTQITKSFNEQGKVIKTVSKTVDQYGNTITNITGKGEKKKLDKILNLGSVLGKLYFIRNYTKQLGRSIANVVQRAMDYVETQNLWQVANRENIQDAREFISVMNKAYGISERTLMNYQAIFKNMLSALGGISDVASSQLSKQLTQFALDFASLYNVSIESAMTKFQAVLSGQVRPIRSISGYDITENTIFDIYQQMGGEKTMRQLSQVEKRLLRIYAVFEQMGATGAVGDMSKTIETASNQVRIMNEQWQEMTMWLGQSILMLLNENKIFQNINAAIITMKEIFKAIAYENGYQEENFLSGMFEDATEASEAVDELAGKLLSFDRFEALNSNDKTGGLIDPKIEELIGKITTQTELAGFEAQKMADEWLRSLGFIDENGDGILDITEKARDFLNVIKETGVALGIIAGLFVVKSIVNIGVNLVKWIVSPVGLLSVGLITLISGIKDFINVWGDMNWLERIAIIFGAVAAAITAAAIALNVFKMNWAGAIGVAALVAGGALTVYSSLIDKTPAYATGGFPEDGLFYANSGELVGGFSNGRTAVANNEQITDGIANAVYPAVYNAMVQANRQTGSHGGGDVILDGFKVGRVVTKGVYEEGKRVGYFKN